MQCASRVAVASLVTCILICSVFVLYLFCICSVFVSVFVLYFLCICICICSTVEFENAMLRAWVAALCVSANFASTLIPTNRLKHEFSTFGKVHIKGLIWLYQLFILPLWPNNAKILDKYCKNTWQIASRGAAVILLFATDESFLRRSLSIKCYH